MKEIFLISITVFLIIIVVLMLIKDKKNKKKKNKTKNYNIGEQLTVDKNIDKKNAKLFNRKAKSINFNEGKSHSGQGIIGGQIKKQKQQQEELKKPIGWIQAKSYEDDVKSSNVSKYVHEEEDVGEKTSENTNISFNKAKPNILVVDDSITVLKFISSLLVKINYEIVTKEDGLAALDFLKLTNRLPDLIITDLEMPKMAGNELVKQIRKETKFKNIPILIVSSNPEPHIYLLEDELVNGIIKKPFDKEDFMEQVKYLINN